MKLIEELFNGNIYPHEAMTDSKTYSRINNDLMKYLSEIQQKLPENHENISEKIRREFNGMEYESTFQAFALGFSLGVRLTAECCTMKHNGACG